MPDMKLLVVDDEERFVVTVAKLLSRRGYEPLTALGGREALEILGRESVDVVILDVKMPGMDGLETLKEIKNRFPLVQVIMLTGHGTIDSAIEGMEKGAYDYIIKPCDLDKLLEEAKAAFDIKQAMEDKIRQA